MTNIINEIKKDLIKNLLPKLNLFKKFKIKKIYKKTDYLGYYKNGSYNMPIIKLNIPEIKECISDKMSLYTIIETTILHELGHAIQDFKGIFFNEIQAEDFAYNYYYNREILKI